MLGVLDQILCWIKQFGALIASGAVVAVNWLIAGLVGLVNLALENWPIGMPSLPDPPAMLLTVYGWFQWGPIAIVTGACLGLLAFLLTVYLAVMVAKPLLKYLGVGGS